MSIESVIPLSHLILHHPLLLPPSIFPSISVFSNESVLCIRWPKHWSFSISISNYFLRIGWFDIVAVQWTLKSLLLHYNSKASILQCSVLFMVQISHPYMTTGKSITLTRWTFVSKVMSMLFNILSRLVIAFLPRSKCLLISQLQSPCSYFGAQENKVCHCFHCFLIYFSWTDGTGCHDPSFFEGWVFHPIHTSASTQREYPL